MDKDNNLTGKQFDAVVSEIKHSKNGEGVDINGFIDKNLTSCHWIYTIGNNCPQIIRTPAIIISGKIATLICIIINA